MFDSYCARRTLGLSFHYHALHIHIAIVDINSRSFFCDSSRFEKTESRLYCKNRIASFPTRFPTPTSYDYKTPMPVNRGSPKSHRASDPSGRQSKMRPTQTKKLTRYKHTPHQCVACTTLNCMLSSAPHPALACGLRQKYLIPPNSPPYYNKSSATTYIIAILPFQGMTVFIQHRDGVLAQRLSDRA